MVIKQVNDDGIITLTAEELSQFRGCKVALFRLNNCQQVFSELQKLFDGEAQNAGFQNEQDLQEYMIKIRREVRGY